MSGAETRPPARGWTPTRYLLATLAASLAAALGLAALRPSMGNDIGDLVGVSAAQAAPSSFYAARVHPVLMEHCAGCHGAKLQRARLRLDSLGEAREGGKNGAVIAAGSSERSPLYQRLVLPNDSPLLMPPKDRPPLREAEIAVIKMWLDAGASAAATPDRFPDAPPPPPPPIKIPPINVAVVEQARAPLADAVEALSQRYAGIVGYAARDSAGLRINAAAKGAGFTDADFAALEPVAAEIVFLDISGTRVSDRSAPVLSGMQKLQRLRAVGAPIGDEFLNAAIGLPALEDAFVNADQASDGAMAKLQQRLAETSNVRPGG